MVSKLGGDIALPSTHTWLSWKSFASKKVSENFQLKSVCSCAPLPPLPGLKLFIQISELWKKNQLYSFLLERFLARELVNKVYREQSLSRLQLPVECGLGAEEENTVFNPRLPGSTLIFSYLTLKIQTQAHGLLVWISLYSGFLTHLAKSVK